MTFLFLDAPQPNDKESVNYGLEMLEAVLLEDGHEVAILSAAHFSVEELVQEVAKQGAEIDVLGVSALPSALPFLQDFFESLYLEIGSKGDYLVIVGGYITTYFYEEIFKVRGGDLIDVVAYGRGEQIVSDIADLALGKLTLGQISNISYRENGQIKSTGRKSVDIANLPWATRSLSLKLKASGKSEMSLLRIYKSVGCDSFCSFCSIHEFIPIDKSLDPALRKKKLWYSRNSEDVVAEMEFLYRKYGVTKFDFVDDDAFGRTPDDWYDISNEIEARGLAGKIEYFILTKVSLFSQDESLIKRMSQTGLAGVFLGFESHNARYLKVFSKASSIEGPIFSGAEEYVEQMLKCIAYGDRFGIRVRLGVINILPDTTFDELKESIEFFKVHSILEHVETLIRAISIYGQTTLMKKYAKMDLLTDSSPLLVEYPYDLEDERVKIFNKYWHQYFVPTDGFRYMMLQVNRFFFANNGLEEALDPLTYYKILRYHDLSIIEELFKGIDSGVTDFSSSVEKWINEVNEFESSYHELFSEDVQLPFEDN